MTQFLELLYQYRNLLLFVALEVLAVVALVFYNDPHRQLFENWAADVGGTVHQWQANASAYFDLRLQNENLAAELIALKVERDSLLSLVNMVAQELPDEKRFLYSEKLNPLPIPDTFVVAVDSLSGKVTEYRLMPTPRVFEYIPCRAINNNTMGAYNYITLNVGRKQGVKPDMGVISGNSVVGFVTSVTDDYALVMSVLNKRAQISAKVKRKEILGSLKWGGGDPRYAQMLHIPLHYQPNVGDTVITSHYSTLYPEGMLLGFIERIEESDIHNGYYDIRVRLATDFRSLNFLYVVRDRNKAAIDKLQSNAR